MKIINKTVLITGGGSGIGYEVAKLLSAAGNKVILVGRTESKIQTAAKTLDNAVAIQCDINDDGDVRMLIKTISEQYPELSVLINNAGAAFLYEHGENAGAFEKATAEFATNYFSVIRLTEGLIPVLKAQPEAAIVNVTSIAAFAPGAYLPSYADSKAALRSYTLSLRHTFSKDTNIKVFELIPPLVNTEFSKEIGGKQNGMPAVEVAEALMDGFQNEEYEIQVGQTAEFRKYYLADPEGALAMMNQG
ncbi:short-chain dehydrogenase [Dyadobacter luteus]|jgi:uncharacterized oxidoreductase|uniref:Short-chain dehydrogenase n=1 Tax=Dyadobacter luteus TaxID=2259619 RepID=A0A3D8YIA2_9BACT|nr:SDR family NAD(P)-dependent oxidoreductase [Dyadobacter luteus]REA64415.1 short-chain dehydrogenase [Dyadobacter luteus]